MEEFFKYWQGVFDYWVEHGKAPQSEKELWDFDKVKLVEELMPTPYFGDPAKCSVVLLNYNPNGGKPESKEEFLKDTAHHANLDKPGYMSHHYARNYREMVASGGYVADDSDPMYNTTGLHPKGKEWWGKRVKWLKELASSTKRPFVLELCGWHSKQWPAMSYKSKLSTLRERFASVIEEAVKNSDLGIGICVGAKWGEILVGFGYKDVTGKVMSLDDYERGWKPRDDDWRNYRIFRNDNGTYIINTWKSKGFNMMDVPAAIKFRQTEEDIIKKINAAKSAK